MPALPPIPHFHHAGDDFRVGIDIVRISRIGESLERFGQRFLTRVYTAAEVAYADLAPVSRLEKLAARFAAKEAAIKALRLAHQAVRWTDLEVHRTPSGECELWLHGTARTVALHAGFTRVALSLSHEDDYATAIVMAGRGAANQPLPIKDAHPAQHDQMQEQSRYTYE